MKTLIILNGECKSTSFLKQFVSQFDRIVCADGGYLHAVSAKAKVNAVVGDFDSSDFPDNVEYIVYPKEKDLSDAEIAIEYAVEKYGKDIVMTCSLGKRLDHQLFNVFLLTKYPFLKIEEDDVLAFMCGKYEEFSKYKNLTVSFLPVGDANVTLENFKYNINSRNVKTGETVTLSNVALKNATVRINSGKVIAVINKTNV